MTAAIYEAQGLERAQRHRDAVAAWRRVADVEAFLAGMLRATEAAGSMSRRGAVSAALGACDPRLAIAHATEFLADADVPEGLRAELIRLRTEAEQQLERIGVSSNPGVVAVKFELKSAA